MIVKAVCVSSERKARAFSVPEALFTKAGIEGDIHFEMRGKHPVSILPIEETYEGGLMGNESVSFGRFGENLVIQGMEFGKLRPGMRLKGKEVTLLIAKIGAGGSASDSYNGFKVCSPMEPYFIFCDVLTEGIVRVDECMVLMGEQRADPQLKGE